MPPDLPAGESACEFALDLCEAIRNGRIHHLVAHLHPDAPDDLGIDLDRLNVNGGAIALGHPLGASGTKLMTTLIHALRARGKRYGLQTMCEGGGIANVTIVEAL